MDTTIRKPNAWVEHVRSFALKNGLSYSCALSDPRCKASYKKNGSVEMSPQKVKISSAKKLARKIKNIELTAQVRKDKFLNEHYR